MQCTGKGREAVLSQFSSIFTQMVALFAAIGVGYICKKTGVMDADFDKRLSGLVLSATLPALILASVLNVDSLPDPVLMARSSGFPCSAMCCSSPSPISSPTCCASPTAVAACTASCSSSAIRVSSATPCCPPSSARRRSYTRLCTTSCSTCCRSPSAPGSSHRTTNTASRCV